MSLCAGLATLSCGESVSAPRGDAAAEAAPAGESPVASAADPGAAVVLARRPPERPSEPTPAAQLGTVPEGYGLQLGDEVPDLALPTLEGRLQPLYLLGQGQPLLLVFYRGGWCPYCNGQIRELSEGYAQLEERGVALAAISVDQVSEITRTAAAYAIPFPLLSDPDLAVHEFFGVIHEVGEEELARLRSFGIDLEAASGRDHHKFAVPAVFLFSAQGGLIWQHADPQYRVRPSLAQLLEVIDRLAPRGAERTAPKRVH